ncbi:hypothetical protein COL154_008514 [Colletotrichum chrysophilum]|uniref:uncharacterized protein n=1 Tax=Colletotrichum chrysophilum TaxID=1836956 RepID=UPI0023001441|nr:uncharacterized protein COL26b_009199 [Colletotrichum chrysophilum]KAJ0270190.1 hypothetical protein COL940_011849 [Colletotrichum noveboracense]KAJ0274819.1 hypothetical protein CBS470a_011575 [Colletotrichum nupharicola]KAJ0302338.1 hypothetical protein Brms1b_012111 [Colletotrichum noveboracense]KAJ0352485.1 hypothetical protein KNSL1_002758 [Colletotrichum chrysophilum]KAJ0359106.1 hypothetical protein COL154_008514 [Colletotrichum chrysophilum]
MDNRQNDLKDQIRAFANALSKSSNLPLSAIHEALESYIGQARVNEATSIAAQEMRQVIPGSEYAVIFHGYHVHTGSTPNHAFGYPINYRTTVALKNPVFFDVLKFNKFNGVLIPQQGQPIPPYHAADYVPGFQSYGCPGLAIPNHWMNILASPTTDAIHMNAEIAFPGPSDAENWDQQNSDPTFNHFLAESFPQQTHIAPPGQFVPDYWNQSSYFGHPEHIIGETHEPVPQVQLPLGIAPVIENNVAADVEHAGQQPVRSRSVEEATMQCPECFKPYKRLNYLQKVSFPSPMVRLSPLTTKAP